MEYLLPLGIVVGLGLAFLLFRRPTVTQLSDSRMSTTTNTAPVRDRSKSHVGVRIPIAAGGSPQVTDEVLREILRQAEAMPSGTKEGTLRMGNALVHWTMNKQVNEVVRTGQGLDAAATMPEEVRLQYPGSTFIVAHARNTHSTDGRLDSGGAYRTTLASSADREQIAAWYEDWMLSHGWQPSPVSGTTPAPTFDYVRGWEHFRLALSDPSTVAPVLALPIPEGTKTVFEVEYSTPTLPSP